MKRKNTANNNERYAASQQSDDDTSTKTVPDRYHTLSLQLLDLMHQLHTKAGEIYKKWMEHSDDNSDGNMQNEAAHLWDSCWCPLLQGIARLCCDARRQVRSHALTFLQRALLNHDLNTLTGKEWESCFNKVIFPLLSKLLENISPVDPDGMEETRMRAAALLSKVFLQHLVPLLDLSTFTALWLTILDFMDKYMHIGKRDYLFEAIPESLKNMLLVMDTAQVFHSSTSGYTSLWDVTWERINIFLPNLKNEVFKPPSPEPPKAAPLEVPAQCESIERDTPPQNLQQQQPLSQPPTQLNLQPSLQPPLAGTTSALFSNSPPTNILMASTPPNFIVPIVASPTPSPPPPPQQK